MSRRKQADAISEEVMKLAASKVEEIARHGLHDYGTPQQHESGRK